MELTLSNTQHILDHTKIKGFMECPRKFFYEHMLGWNADRDDHNLVFGAAFHLALEYLYDRQKQRGSHHLSERDADEAWLMFMEFYREQFPEETDADYAPKDPATADRVLREYIKLYGPLDTFEVLYSEISGAVPVDETGRLVHFRLDAVVKDIRSGTYLVLEHKTSKWSPSLWEYSMALSLQGGVGVHVLSCLYPQEQVKGLVYNGIFFFKKGPEFRRMPYIKSNEGMQDWFLTINRKFEDIERETAILLEEDSPDAPAMRSFPKNPTSCVLYNRPCPYMDFCKAWANPLRHISDTPPTGFTKKYWDPRELDKEWRPESAKVVSPEEVK